MTSSEDPSGIILTADALRPETLRAVVEEFVSREGTDYGRSEFTLDEKVGHVMRQLQRGEAHLTFDPASGTVDIVARARR